MNSCCWIFISIVVSLNFVISNCISDFPILIVVSFDGFRYDYLDKAENVNLHRLIDEGVTAKWMKNAFITKTFPNHYTIATGFYEESHGIVGNEMFDPKFNETFHLSNTDTKWWDNGHVIPIWIANQLANPSRHSGGMMWPATNVKIHNRTASYHYTYNKLVTWEERVDTAMSWLTNDTNPANCVFLYFEEPDGTGHDYGPNSREVVEQIIRVDNLTGYLIRQLESYNLFKKTNLIILSDHGMSDVPIDHLINMDKIIDASMYEKFGSSPVWNILPLKGQEEQIYKNLTEGSKLYNYRVYYKKAIPMNYHYKNNRRVMPILVAANVGWGLTKTGESTEGTRGQHGYNNSVPEMWPLFVAHGPSFQLNYTSDSFYNVDLYPLMCHLLQMTCMKTNGSLSHVFNMLKYQSIVFPKPSLPTVWIVGIVSLLIFCVIGGITVITITTLKKQQTVRSDIGMTPVLTATVRTDKQNSSMEEQQLLIDPSFDD